MHKRIYFTIAAIGLCCVAFLGLASAQMLQAITNASTAAAGFTQFTVWGNDGAYFNTASRTTWTNLGANLE